MPDRRPSIRAGGERGVEAALFAALVVLSFAFFARAIGFDFVDFDDRAVLLGHPNLYNESSFLASLRAIFIDYFPREEPLLLRDVSWAWDARLFGLANPFGFHLGNVVLNALNVGLLFLLLRRWIGSLRIAGVVAALFAVLPVHVEAVCWAMGRKDMLAAFFMLVGLLAQTAELRAVVRGHRRALLGIAVLCTICALFAKASSVAFVLVLALHRLLHRYLGSDREAGATARVYGTSESRSRFALAMLPHAVATIAFLFWYRGVLIAWGVFDSTSPGPTSPEHLFKVATFLPLILGRYLLSLVWPVQLSMFYRWPHVAIPLTPLELLGSAFIALAVAAGLVLLWRRRRDLAVYAFVALALLAPYTGLQYVGFWAADRYLYLASGFGLAIVVIPLAEWAARNRTARVAIVTLGLGFLLVSGAQAWLQQGVWRDNESLWSYEAYRDEPSLLSIQALAKHYVKRATAAGDPAARSAWVRLAEHEIDRGFERHSELRLQPTPYKVKERLHLGRLHYLQGRVRELQGAPTQEQLVHFERAFAIAPDRLTAMMLSRGLFELASREEDEARRRVLYESSFDFFLAYVEMGRRDPRRLAQSRDLLASNFEGRFPFLDERIAAAKRTYFP